MKYRCQECGGLRVFDIGFPVNNEDITVNTLNEETALNRSQLPYYIGGYYCEDCQSFVSIVEEMEPEDEEKISDKQKTFLKYLLETLKVEGDWPDEKIDNLTQREAGKLIWKLKRKYDKRPKKVIPAASEKQKKYVENLCKKAGREVDIDNLNVVDASRLIKELTEN